MALLQAIRFHIAGTLHPKDDPMSVAEMQAEDDDLELRLERLENRLAELEAENRCLRDRLQFAGAAVDKGKGQPSRD